MWFKLFYGFHEALVFLSQPGKNQEVETKTKNINDILNMAGCHQYVCLKLDHHYSYSYSYSFTNDNDDDL